MNKTELNADRNLVSAPLIINVVKFNLTVSETTLYKMNLIRFPRGHVGRHLLVPYEKLLIYNHMAFKHSAPFQVVLNHFCIVVQ